MGTDLPFQLSTLCFKYLGLNITEGFPKLYKDNFVQLVDKLKLDLKK